MTSISARTSSPTLESENKSTFHDRALFYTACEIQRFIHSLSPYKILNYHRFGSEDMRTVHGRGLFAPLVHGHLTTNRNQTKQGLVLEERILDNHSLAKYIHTPFGSLELGSSPDTDTLTEPLKLEKTEAPPPRTNKRVRGSSFRTITHWNGQSIELHKYRDAQDYISQTEANKAYQDMSCMLRPTLQEDPNQLSKEERCARVFSLKKPLLTMLRDRELHGNNY